MTDDSPPFTNLLQHAEDFKTTFDSDIDRCLSTLNSKITDLLLDPDNSAQGGGPRSNTHVEFSMSKYRILAQMKEVYRGMEEGWMDSLRAMREEFEGDVETFLANTKLEVKFPAISPRSALKNSAAKGAKQDKSPGTTVSSIYPKLFNTAKHIPGLSSLLPQQEEEESSGEELPPVTKTSGRTPKRVTINTSQTQYFPSPAQNGTSRRRANTPVRMVSNVVEISDDESEIGVEEEPVVVQTPVKRAGRGRKSVATPAKETVSTPLRGRNTAKTASSDSSSSNEDKAVPVVETRRRGRKSVVAQPVAEVPTPKKRGRTPRKKPNEQTVVMEEVEVDQDEDESDPVTASQRSPKQVQFSLGLDVTEELDIYSPELNLTRSAPRRKTMMVRAAENFPDISLTPDVVRTKSKRKTFGGNLLDQSVAPSPKRLKRCGGRTSLAPSALDPDEHMDTNPLESEGATDLGRYSPWIPLSDISGGVPTKPGVYELKVAQAKKPAYIGSCDSLRQKLTLHRLAQASGHKHLDKFVERNGANVLVRYENMPSVAVANEEGKKRLKNFVAQYKTSPAYN